MINLPSASCSDRERSVLALIVWVSVVILRYNRSKHNRSTARAMHDQHAVNSACMSLTASIKPGKYMCTYEKVCAYKKGAPNNPSLRYLQREARDRSQTCMWVSSRVEFIKDASNSIFTKNSIRWVFPNPVTYKLMCNI